MDNDRKTGLGGGSLLLRRTEPVETEPSTASAIQPPETPTEPQAAQPSASSKGKKHRAIPRDKCTLHLDHDVNEWLDLAARVEGRERSEVASELLRKHLPRYSIQVRKQDD
jgi:hypothetical protein